VTQAEGASLLCGGAAPSDAKLAASGGFYIPPTVFGGVTPSHTIFREEVFGPVAGITTFKTAEEALELANASVYGLAAAVFTSDAAVSKHFAEELRAGIVWVNNAQPSPHAQPWGGFKRSGVGRELGPLALLPFLEVKAVTNWDAGKPAGWYPAGYFTA
jgi:betaine-aldehyde dehydrogenase